MKPLNIGVLISGRGSNLQALITAAAQPGAAFRVQHVISNRKDAPGLDHAAAAGIEASVVNHKEYASRAAFEQAMTEILRQAGVDLIALAGFMRLLTGDFIAAWKGQVVNIHPSLLPAFPGLNSQRQALTAGVRIAGCTVHYVTAEMDAGPIIAQAAVAVAGDDDESSLSARILKAEHRLYPLALTLIARKRLQRNGTNISLAPDLVIPNQAILSPTLP